MTLVRYAVRALEGDRWVYRSARYRGSFGPWDGAQLWENPKKAAEEAKNHREPRSQWREPIPSATVIVVNIGEPA